jgi:hypothetical protein
VSKKSRERQRLKNAQVAKSPAGPIRQLGCFPYDPRGFKEAGASDLNPHQAEFMQVLRSEFPDVEPVRSLSTGKIHAASASVGLAFDLP